MSEYTSEELSTLLQSHLYRKYQEYIAKDGDPLDLVEFWRWLVG